MCDIKNNIKNYDPQSQSQSRTAWSKKKHRQTISMPMKAFLDATHPYPNAHPNSTLKPRSLQVHPKMTLRSEMLLRNPFFIHQVPNLKIQNQPHPHHMKRLSLRWKQWSQCRMQQVTQIQILHPHWAPLVQSCSQPCPIKKPSTLRATTALLQMSTLNPDPSPQPQVQAGIHTHLEYNQCTTATNLSDQIQIHSHQPSVDSTSSTRSMG